jgi:transposase-like protein
MTKKTKKMLEIEKIVGEPIEEYLRREYIGNKKSTVEIGKILGMPPRNVNTWLKKFEIPTRSSSEAYFIKYNMDFEKPSDEQLLKWYIDEKMSSKEIAEIVGVHYASVVNWLKKANIERRTASEAKILSNTKRETCKWKKEISGDELYMMYVDKKMSTNEIGEILSVNGSTVLNWLKDARIPIRNQYEAKLAQYRKEIERPSTEQLRRWYVEEKMNTYEIGELVGVSYNLINKWLREANIPIRDYYESRSYLFEKPSKERLRKWYLDERKSTGDIAKIVGVDSNSVLQWLKDANIKRRTLSDAQFAIYDKEIERPSDEQLRKWYIGKKKSTREVGELVGVTYQTVQGWLREAGIPRRYGTVAMIKREKPSDDQLRKWYIDERKSGSEIGEIIGVTPGVIHRWLRKAGVRVREAKAPPIANSWERLCREIASTMFGRVNKYPSIPNPNEGVQQPLHPDWGINYNGEGWEILFDAKIGAWAASIEEDIEHYLPHCERLEFWCSRGKRESDDPRVKFVFAEELIDKLNEMGREDLIDKVRIIVLGVDPYDKRQTKLTFI